ncbi:MAG TPA: MBL fold metallo-hydrolase [Acidimicrobiales bacterium]|nr:MBL fold metallo-hydrolase [Acidimicrobiales bacterium]
MKQEQEPAGDGVEEVGPGVLRVQLPIDMPGLGHVNTYLLLDDKGAAVVDPGLHNEASWDALVARLKRADLRVKDVHTVLVTHSHPDHYGGAGRLAEESGAEVATHAAFRIWWAPDPCDAHVHDVDPDDAHHADPYSGTTPWGTEGYGKDFRERVRKQAVDFRHPRPARRLRHGDTIELAGRPWTAVHTPGHTLDHLCLVDPEAGLLLSGDHVLPTITPHISGMGTGRDPLKAFVESLERIAAVPEARTALPAHGHPFTDVQERTTAIRRHHEERLDKLVRTLEAMAPDSATVAELSHELFRSDHWGPMAESETYAHLEHLRLRGDLVRGDDQGLMAYAAVTRTSPT